MEAQMQNDLKNGPGDSKIGFFHATLKRSGDVSSSEDEFVPNSDSRYIILHCLRNVLAKRFKFFYTIFIMRKPA